MSEPERAAIDWLRQFTDEVSRPAEFAALVAQLDEAIAAEVPEVSADSELRRDLDASTAAQARVFFEWLVTDSTEVQPPPAAHALARTVARRGLPLRLLMRIYRAGHQAAQGFVAQSVRDLDLDSAVQTPALLRLWDRTSQWLNVSLEVLTDTYTEERERGLRGALARRTATAHAILRGDQVDQDTATTQLGYPLRQTHTALVLWADELPVGMDPVAHLEAATNALAAAVAAPNVLTVPSGARGLWAWFTGAFEFGELALPDGVRVAAGEPGRGMAGFRRGHVEALAAQRIAERTPDRPRFTRYADVEIAHLVSADETAARALVARELRGLTGDDPSARQLRQTLHAYLAADRSPEAAARALHVHKNTVRYRINRVEQLLGHPVAERRLHLELALAYLRTTDDAAPAGA